MGREPSEKAPAASPIGTCYVRLLAEVSGLVFEAGLNDMPLVSSGELGDCLTDFGVNEFLTGQDMLWARVKGSGTLSLKLYLADPAKPEPTPLRMLATLDYPADADRFAEEPMGLDGYAIHVGRIPVQYGDPRPPLRVAPFWGEAERLGPALSPGQRQQAFALLEGIRAAVLAKNAPAVAGALAYKTRDVALANYHDPAEQAQIVQREIGGLFQGGGKVTAMALAPDNIEWVMGAGQRLVLARIPRTYAMPLQFEVDEVEFGLECYLGRVGGEWRLVR